MKYKEEIEKDESYHQKTEILKETIHQVEEAEYVVMIQARIGRTTLTKTMLKHPVQKKYMRLQF